MRRSRSSSRRSRSSTRPATRRGPNVGIYNARFYEGRYLAGIVAGKMTKTNVARLRRRVPDSRSAAGHQRVHARRAQRQSRRPRCSVIWVELVVRPGQGARGGRHADVAGRRRAHASHRLDRRRAGRGGEGQVRVRLSLRHVEVRPERAAHRGDAPLGRRTTRRSRSDVLDGKWKPTSVWGGMKDGMIKLAPLNTAVPADVKDAGREARSRHQVAGKLHPFAGPVKDQDGKERLAAGQDDDRRRAAARWTSTSKAWRASCRRNDVVPRSCVNPTPSRGRGTQRLRNADRAPAVNSDPVLEDALTSQGVAWTRI